MEKTGESYTATRSALLAKTAAPAPPKAVAPKAEWPALAGMSDEAVHTKTGRTWAQWVKALDDRQAWQRTHRDIAKHLAEHHDTVSPWWAQGITIGYERIRGLRDVGQRREGSYDANKTRTFSVGVATLYRMFAEARRRRRWLPEGLSKIRTSKVNVSMLLDWDDGTSVSLYFTDKGPDKSSVSVQHSKLPDKAAADAAKNAWHLRLDALRDALR